MKKILLFIAAALALGGAACAGVDRPVGFDGLPVAAKQFVSDYFPGREVVLAKVDGHLLDRDYEVIFSNGDTAEFDDRGEWTEVVCREGGVPAGIVPRPIAEYVGRNYPDAVIVEISRSRHEYDVELSNGWEIEFDRNFNVTDLDR